MSTKCLRAVRHIAETFIYFSPRKWEFRILLLGDNSSENKTLTEISSRCNLSLGIKPLCQIFHTSFSATWTPEVKPRVAGDSCWRTAPWNMGMASGKAWEDSGSLATLVFSRMASIAIYGHWVQWPYTTSTAMHGRSICSIIAGAFFLHQVCCFHRVFCLHLN